MREIFINDVGWVRVPDILRLENVEIRLWTPRETRILAALYGKHGSDFTARALNRSVVSIIRRASKLGISANRSRAAKAPRADSLGRVA